MLVLTQLNLQLEVTEVYNDHTVYMKHRSLFLPFITLLSCNTVFSRNLEHHSLNTTPTEIPLGGMTRSPPKDGQVVPSMASKALGYRYPQMPLDVDGYAVAPHNIQLEQVHIYVRHGAFLKIKGLRAVNSFLALCTAPGERTPVGVRLSNPPASIPEHWTMCRMANRFSKMSDTLGVPSESEEIPMTKVLDHRIGGSQSIPKLVERIDGTTAEGEW
jgi:hypothetical protein